jgi:teichuronic acid exporter
LAAVRCGALSGPEIQDKSQASGFEGRGPVTMQKENVKKIAVSGIVWQMLEKILVNGVQFIIYVILARLLEPGDFGIVAILSVFIVFSDLLVNSGLGTAIIQKKNADDKDYNSVLYASLLMSLILYGIIFAIAPLVARFYGNALITNSLRLYALSIIFFSLNGVQRSIMFRHFNFRKVFVVSTLPVFLAGAVGILLAFLGFGVYALIANYVVNSLLCVIVSAFLLRWRPKLIFAFDRIKKLYSYSYKLLLANLIDTGYRNLFPLVIGKVYSSTILGFYNYGRQIPNLISSSINSSIISVVFPIYSRSQDDKESLKEMVRKSISMSSFVIFPIMAGLSAVARPLIEIMLTAKWLPSVPYVRLFCIVFGLYHVQTVNFHAISAIGRSDVFLKYELFKKIAGIIILAASVPLGLTWIVLGQVLTIVLSIGISVRPNRRFLNYDLREQFADYLPPLVLSVAMFLTISLLGLLPLSLLPALVLQVVAGILFYMVLARLLRMKGYRSLISVIKTYGARRLSPPVSANEAVPTDLPGGGE